ncbi:hypothetical protein BDY19DRAFT_925674 [Irpex rosettiformis]|uniref:Uncharacterized protein n=1 Tax=Irpex rosettiformis TaxID=378272 RepID=A0ACB8UEA2_9APHY|nr:hypothetical protein BDY19DRAFT_925674 [Irpex rosettiformis]
MVGTIRFCWSCYGLPLFAMMSLYSHCTIAAQNVHARMSTPFLQRYLSSVFRDALFVAKVLTACYLQVPFSRRGISKDSCLVVPASSDRCTTIP